MAKVCCFIIYEAYKIYLAQPGNLTYRQWYQCNIFMFWNRIFPTHFLYRDSIKKVLWSDKFGKCSSRMVCFLSLLSQRKGSWWDNGYKAIKQEISSGDGLKMGGEVIRSVDCAYLAWSWFGVLGEYWRNMPGRFWHRALIYFMGRISYVPLFCSENFVIWEWKH